MSSSFYVYNISNCDIFYIAQLDFENREFRNYLYINEIIGKRSYGRTGNGTA